MVRLVISALAATLLVLAPAAAQRPPVSMDVWDLALGAHYIELPEIFIGHACGGNGGPPGAILKGFATFRTCKPEDDGLYEIYIRDDDELEYWARAHDYAGWIERFRGTKVIGREVILSLLLNEAGRLHGIRVVTDPNVDETTRYNSYGLGNLLAARFAVTAADCVDLPRGERETAIGDRFVKQRCDKMDGGERRLILETRFYRKAGQFAIDPHTKLPTQGQFESSTRLEIRLATGASTPLSIDQADAAPPVRPSFAPGSREADLVSGRSRDCPGCDLSGANLKRRDLSGGDLSAAILREVNFHDAKLGRANLFGADLTDANLNKADLRRADLRTARLAEAMLYEAHLDNANLTGADLTGAMMGRARLTRARLVDAILDGADLRQARLAEATLAAARLVQTWLDHAQLGGANLSGATIIESSFYQAAMRDADLSGAWINRSDLFDADLARANLSAATISSSRLQSAILDGARLDGTVFTATIMPDGTVHD